MEPLTRESFGESPAKKLLPIFQEMGQFSFRSFSSAAQGLLNAGRTIQAALLPHKTYDQLLRESGMDGGFTPQGRFQQELFGTDEPISPSSVGAELRGGLGGERLPIDPILGVVAGLADATPVGKAKSIVPRAANLAQDVFTGVYRKYGPTVASKVDDLGDSTLAKISLMPGGEEEIAKRFNVDKIKLLTTKVTDKFADVARARKSTEAARTLERSDRFKKAAEVLETGEGEGAFRAAKKELEGELPRDRIQSQLKFDEGEVRQLAETVRTSDNVSWLEKIQAHEALGKVLGDPYHRGHIPSDREVAILSKIFGNAFGDSIQKMKGSGKWSEILSDAVGVPRSIMATGDFSATLRQGFILGVSHPIRAVKAMGTQAISFFDERYFNAAMANLQNSQFSKFYSVSGLEFTDIGRPGLKMTKREEVFRSDLAHRIPGVGLLVRAGERAFVGYLNTLRASVYDDVAKEFLRSGMNLRDNLDEFRGLASFINHATGRGELFGKLKEAGPLLSTVLFSPRLLASRVQLMNPAYYYKLPPAARKYARKTMARFIGVQVGLLSLAKLGGAEIELDPRSSDFAKVKIGNVRYDIGTGFNPIIVLLSRLVMRGSKNLRTGEIDKLGKEEYPFKTGSTLLAQFFRNKLAPVPSLLYDLFDEKTSLGDELTVKNTLIERLIPLYLNDFIEAWNEENAFTKTVSGPSAFMGVGVSRYETEDGRAPRSFDEESFINTPISDWLPELPWIEGGGGGRTPKTY